VILGALALLGLVFLSAFGSTKLLCSPTSHLALFDHPNERSLHAAPIHRTGGLAIFGSVALGLLLSLVLGWSGVTATALWILGVTLLVGAVSFWDDRTGLSPWLRLSVHALAAIGVVWGAGLQARTVLMPFAGTLSLGWLAVPATILFLIWMANLYNFMDGMDGFAGGMTVLGYGFLGYVAWRGGHQLILLLSLLVAGAVAGFLWYNLPPARIFMGDVGSVPLGFLAAALALLGVRDGVFDVWVPLLIFSPFIVDATVTLVRRLLRGEKIWRAHREHYYQRLVLAGWGHRKTVMAEYVLMLACGMSAVVYIQVSEPWRMAILLGWMAVYTVLMWGVCVVERQAKVVGAAG
jgi:UDP-N-acetylmuramyl pentapeptide phosphotransferase/UDP-N-acetylglucosamine-1-phosphate transferase